MTKRVKAAALAAVAAVRAAISGIDRTDVLLVTGLLLLAAGLWEWWRPAAYLVPGAVLVWIALPPRAPFLRG